MEKHLRVLISPAHYFFTDNLQVSEPRYSYCITSEVAKGVNHVDVIVGSASLVRQLPKHVNLITIYKGRSQNPAIEMLKYILFYPLVCIKYLSLEGRYDIVHHIFPTSPYTVDPLLILIKLISPKTKIIIGPLQLLSNLGSPQDLSLMLIGKRSSSILNPFLPILFHFFTKIAQPISRITYSAVDVIVCSFETIKDYYKHVYTSKPIVVIPIGVNKTPFEDFSRKSHKFVTIISVGWLMSHKGHGYLLKAFKSLVGQVPSARLLLVGEGELRQEYEDFVYQNKLADNVLFTGRVPHEQVERLYRRADIYCLPSLVDTNPVVVIEAMSHGIPVIASRVGAVPEIVGSAGVIVDKEDSQQLFKALLRLTKDMQLRKSMGQNGRLRVEKLYNWHVIGQRWLKLYNFLVTHDEVPNNLSI